ncbi:MAG TPA: hypothetical protein PKY22_06985, partial [Accumulibacter sp.]|nr:hypothetical protein [Accumulibacter sp.]
SQEESVCLMRERTGDRFFCNRDDSAGKQDNSITCAEMVAVFRFFASNCFFSEQNANRFTMPQTVHDRGWTPAHQIRRFSEQAFVNSAPSHPHRKR